jgi:hypothetical protein
MWCGVVWCGGAGQIFSPKIFYLDIANKLYGETIRKERMMIFNSFVIKGAKFLTKQAGDITKYGMKQVSKSNVSEEILNCFTPFRRISQKPCNLSDPIYYISKFETAQGKDYLPINWSKMTEAQKTDYIVKDRYSKLVANKIMNKIKLEPTEHGFALNPDGNIVHYSAGDTTHCSISTPENGISIHNHPGSFSSLLDEDEIELIRKYKPTSLTSVPHGGEDLTNIFTEGERASYVVDSLGNKFVVEPSAKILEMSPWNRMNYISEVATGINKGDVATVAIHKKYAAEKAAKVDTLYEKAVEYEKLKGTPQFDEAKYLQYKVDFTEAKYKERYPNLSWREEFLEECGRVLGFKFRKI